MVQPFPRRLRRRFTLVPRLLRRERIRWWLIYGPPRCGTSLMMRLVSAHARLVIGDWGLEGVLHLPPELPYIHFDRARFRRDLARNLYLNAPAGGGSTLDVAFKQANLTKREHDDLVALWGPPARTVFCYRDPAGFIASARKKFPDHGLARLQDRAYVTSMRRFQEIGGDPFEYRADLTLADYAEFLCPLEVDGSLEFRYTGEAEPEHATPAMWAAYETLGGRAT